MDPIAIQASSLNKTFKTKTGLWRTKAKSTVAVEDVSFAVERGELFGLLGPNGAGKTTTVKMLTTLLLPTGGTARILGLDVVQQVAEVRKHIGFAFSGSRGLYNRLTAIQNLKYFAELYALDPQVTRKRIPELLELVGLGDRGDDRVETYSSGMTQRLHLARALLHDPDVLFLDEPTVGIDPIGSRELRQTIRTLISLGKTILLTTHYMAEAEELCQRIAIINRGRIVALDSPDALKRRISGDSVIEICTQTAQAHILLDRLRILDGRTVVDLKKRRRTRKNLHSHSRTIQGSRAACALSESPVHPGAGSTQSDPGRCLCHHYPGRKRMRGMRWRLVKEQAAVQFRAFTLDFWSLGLFVIQPAVFTAVGMLLSHAAGNAMPDLVYSVIGGGIMGMWSGIVFTSSFDITGDRRTGVLEMIVGSPTPLTTIEAIRSLTNVLTGLFSLGLAFIAALAIFGYSLKGVNFWGTGISLLLLLFSMWCIGVFLANFLAWSRISGTFVDYLEMPVAFLCGFMYPIRVLPGWLQIISGVLPVRWALQAMDESLLGNRNWSFLVTHWAAAVGISLFFIAITRWLQVKVQDSIRLNGELSSI